VSIRESTSAPPTKWRGDKGRPQPTGPLAIFCVRWSNSVLFKAWYLERCCPREFGRTVERPLPPFLASVTARIVPNYSACRKRNSVGMLTSGLPLFEIALVLVRVDHIASGIVNADHGIV
jgi:hypothetical protein